MDERYQIEEVYSKESGYQRPAIVPGCESLTLEVAIKKYFELKGLNPLTEFDVKPVRIRKSHE